MAINLEDLQSLGAVIRDVRVAPDGAFVQFRLIGFTVDILDETPPLAVECKAPVVAGRIILNATEMQSDGSFIPDYYLPAKLEHTLATYLQQATWKKHNPDPHLQKAPTATADELLAQAAMQFINTTPGATGFQFGQAALDKFKEIEASHAST